MEYAAGARGGAGCGAYPGRADGQAHQRRISKRSLHPAGQHHDAGARRGYDVICAARDPAGHKYAVAASAPESSCAARARGGKEAAGAEARAHAGFACPSDSCCSRSLE